MNNDDIKYRQGKTTEKKFKRSFSTKDDKVLIEKYVM